MEIDKNKLLFIRFHMADGVVSKLIPTDHTPQPTASILKRFTADVFTDSFPRTRKYRYFSSDIENNYIVHNFIEEVT